MAETFSRQYETASGLVEVIITYDQSNTPYFLDFDVVEDIELSYGYEDEDQLTFYPNVVRVVFDDFKKQNYDVLKSSVGSYANTLPENKLSYGGLEIKLDGNRKFKGYIDELSIEYDEEKLQTSFEALCLSHQLKNMNVDRDKIIKSNGERYPDNVPITLKYALYGPFKQIWNDFAGEVYYYNNINNNYSGFFIKHDWIFYGNDVLENTCEGQRNLFNGMPGDPFPIPDLGNPESWKSDSYFASNPAIMFNLDSTGMFNQNRPCKTWADYLKLIALQFGATIGIMDYGKVYFIKRFGNYNINPIDISNKIINDEFNKNIHLPILRGVVIKNHWNGDRIYEYGEIDKTTNNEFKYEDKIKVLDTYIGSYNQNGRGTCIYTLVYYPPCEIYYLVGCWNVKDPQLNVDGQIFEILGKWQHDNRNTVKDKIECNLYGIEYDMVTTYKITLPNTNNISVNFRAMTLKKSLLRYQTEIIGIEV